MVIFLTQRVYRCKHWNNGIIVSCAIVVPIESVGAVEFLAVILVWLQVVSVVVCRGAKHSAKRIVVRYLSHNAKFVYNGAVVAIVISVFHNFNYWYFTAVNVQNYFWLQSFLPAFWETRAEKRKSFDSSFSALLFILQDYALWALQKTVNALEERANVSSQIKMTFQIVYCRSNFLGMKKNSSIASPYSSL